MPAAPGLALGAALISVLALLAPPPAAARSANAAALQVALKGVGLYGGDVDGVRGPMTRAAVRELQRRKGLAVDGIAGPQTRRALGRRGRPSLGSRAMSQPQSGWDVAALQFLLWRRGFSPIAIDGGFGPATERAVLAYQRTAGLVGDGLAGPATIRSLRSGASTPTAPVRFYRPVPGPIGDGFGLISGRRHTGIDFPVPAGTRVEAAGVGTTIFAGWNSGGYGNLVVVKHRLGYTSWYAHLSTITSWPGEAVTGGTRIGHVGSTGRSTGPHLHFEVRRFGVPLDPVPYLLAGTAARAATARPAPPRALECEPDPDAGVGRARSRFDRARLLPCH
jgi:murein DD-endopeptidase MepM/ murein hydrolase activator NlpD